MTLVLITGASSGIGAAAARRYARGGATVILIARSAGKLEALATEIGENAVAMPADASDAEAISTIAQKVLTEHGAPDVIVHAAGAGRWKALVETPPDEAREMMAAPYFAAYNVTYAFLPAMLERDRGVIISVNSPAGYLSWPDTAGYGPARAALRAFHEALAHDLQGTGVHACHAVFGEVASDYWTANPGSREKMPRLASLMPVLKPEDCAAALADLARRPRHTLVRPGLIRLYIIFDALFPWLVRRLVRL